MECNGIQESRFRYRSIRATQLSVLQNLHAIASKARGRCSYPNDRYFPPGFLPISFSTSLTMLRSTNWSRSGSGFPCGSAEFRRRSGFKQVFD